MSSIIPILYYCRKVESRPYKEYLRDTTDPFNISDKCFIDNYRLPKHLVHNLIRDINEFIDDDENSLRIPLHLEVLACLNFYATGTTQRRVSLDGVSVMSQSKISFCVSRISKIIGTELAGKFINFPETLAEANSKKDGFFDKYNVPGIVGLIDCTHIAVARIPKSDQHAYVNSKGFQSINTQVICDVDLRILGLNARYCGWNEDAHIWGGSKILPVLQKFNLEDNKTWLFGDNAYALKGYMMVPYHMPSTNAQLEFNKMHTKIRSDIERCCGILKGRFRCLKRSTGPLHQHDKAAYIIYACGTLHNILIDNNFPIEDVDDEAMSGDGDEAVSGDDDEAVSDDDDEAVSDDDEEAMSNDYDSDEEANNLGEQNREFLSSLIQEKGISF